ncbi:PucR family transcriptional regulator [Geobacillus sp. JS12]|uniref:PucR family transcriptional regulator n=1 Tax=Geobacillus sp. JS12 TaxID=1813182 RepID=UPI00078BDF45|nr:PucR family transcriptional regulator [Geobacillus sp. JS12]AMQ20738.1 PucR family transcriptional regulator [Geobacillus sp. JS12]
MKISDLFRSVPAFQSARLVAGQKGKDREVYSVNMMDAPDIADYLKPNELLVTTAYHLKDKPNDLLELVQSMVNRQCAGLAIKTKRFLHEIPHEVLAFANKMEFPLIELPIHIALGDVVTQTLSRILDKRTNELLQAIETHQKFTEHIMSGKGISSLLKNLSSIIRHPVLLLDKYLRVISSSHPDFHLLVDLTDLHKNGYRLFLQKTPYSCFSLLGNKKTFSAFPIYTHEEKSGCLIIVGTIPFSKPSLVLTVEQATNVIAFEFMKEKALKQYGKRVRNEFFNNIIEGAFHSQEEIVIKAKEFQIENEQPYVCVVGKLDENLASLSFIQSQKEIDMIFEWIEDETKVCFPSVHHFVKGTTCVSLFPISQSWNEFHTTVFPFLKELQYKIKNTYNRTISFGVSNLCTQFLDVQKGFKEALEALQIGQLANHHQFIQIYRRKDISELLQMIPPDYLKTFYYETFQKLALSSTNERDMLLQTLFVFLENHEQISETAKKLYVHRNTVIYRLKKCEELIQKDLKDPETTFRLRLAFRIKHLLHL